MRNIRKCACRKFSLAFNIVLSLHLFLGIGTVAGLKNCAYNRNIFTSSVGAITDGSGSYPGNSNCEWLIRAPYKNQTISINFTEFYTECCFDFLHVFDGGSYASNLLGSFTGNDLPAEITSSSSEVLILLFSDYFTVNQGFSLTYEATDCPRKCSGLGTCSSGKCICAANHKGEYCQWLWCPKLCYQSSSKGSCNIPEQKCKCNAGYFGDSCSLSSSPNADSNSWHKMSSQSTVFKPRARHVAAYMKETNALWVHGGQSFNEVFDDTLMYNLTSNTWQTFPAAIPKPAARFEHAGDVYLHNLVIFGGELAQGATSDELWMFNTITKTWSQPPGHNINRPHAVAGHTANVVRNKLYIFGGRTQYGGFSTDVFQFDLQASSGWKKLAGSGVQQSLLKLVGHSTVYNSYTNSLLIFGGEVAVSSRKDSVKQKRLLSFNLDQQTWTELVPHQSAPNMLPSGRSFHSAVIAGDYMVIYGGLLSSSILTKCHSNELLYYNIKCNSWVSESTITSKAPASSLSEPPSKGRYSHVSVMMDYQTMLVVGGYNGSMRGDVMAYRFPKSVVFKNSSGDIEAGKHCGSYVEINTCHNDPACGWCDDNSKCFALQDSHKCVGKFDTRYCTSHCSAYTSCTSCILFGNASSNTCSWCVHDRKCYQATSPSGRCSADKAGLQIGWWGGRSKLLTKIEQCMTEDLPPGLTLTEFKKPENGSFPDRVSVIETSHIGGTNIDDYMRKYQLKGSVYPYVLETNPSQSKRRDVFLSGSKADIMLSISQDGLATSKKQVASIVYSNDVRKEQAKLQNNADLFPVYSKNASFYMECEVNVSRRSSYQAHISWNLTSSSAASQEVINASFLHPYTGGNCQDNPTCMACMTDSGCGWCPAKSSCIARSSWSTCVDLSAKLFYLVLNQSKCFRCSDYHDCKTCAEDSYCSWKPISSVCSRKGLHAVEVKSSLSCPLICSSRSNCTSCLADNECRWCAGKQKCYAASNHMMQFSMGECLQYQIRDSTLKDQTCRNCSRHSTCAACFSDHRCGWCGNVDNPLIGVCREGDFSGPKTGGNCSTIMSTNNTVAWSYERCPDVDECRLKLYSCDSNATCFNTYGSYNCVCNRGYTGDGKSKCEKTCYHACHHGYCGSDYQCKCDLGWKGINCSINCGCNGHSTCDTGIGVCDLCQGNTRGKYCQDCILGAFGNATTSVGCKRCQCNQHGDVNRGVCDRNTGKCFCRNHTTGDHCERCDNGLAGDPRNGGICYHDCSHFTPIKNNTSGNLSFKTAQGSCVWIITASNASNQEIMYGKEKLTNSTIITINFSYLKLSCQYSHVYVYDGVPQGSTSTSSDFKLLASVCGYDPKIAGTIVSTSGKVTVLFKGPQPGSKFNAGNFVASFNLHDCPYRCTGNRICQADGINGQKCVCKSGWTGVACNKEWCPKNCSSEIGQGYCDANSSKCICLPGFTGADCNQTSSSWKFSIKNLLLPNAEQPKPRYGHTFLYYNTTNVILMFGGRSLDLALYSDVWSFRVMNHTFTKVATLNKPNARYFHCGVIYKGKMIIYGGITVMGVSNDLLSFKIDIGNWTVVTPSRLLPTLFGQTCTLVNNFMFVIGGYSHTDGLNEFALKINLDTFSWEYLKVKGFPITGVYGHSAVYDSSRNNIFVFGGIAFFKEKVQESNRVYSLDLSTLTWNYIQPVPKNAPFPLFLHSAAVLDDVMYVTGGYSDSSGRGFNGDILIWKMKCDQWMKISLTDLKYSQGNQFTSVGVGASLTSANRSLILYPGYNGRLSGDVLTIKPPPDLCTLLRSKSDCLVNVGCSWCQSNVLKNNGSCYSTDASIPFPCNSTTVNSTLLNTTASPNWAIFPGTPCNTAAVSGKSCGSYDSCVSCLATFPGQLGPNCHWCLGQGCVSLGQVCTVSHDLTSVGSCLELGCEASSCDNCGGTSQCFWTRHYQYSSETHRAFSQSRQYDWNCFRKYIEKFTTGNVTDKAPPNKCPKKCVSFTSCSTCLASEGAEGGSKECFWSQKLNTCLPTSRKSVACVSGDCATLYDSSSGCPAACEGISHCQMCLKNPECGWCAQPGVLGKGVCRAAGLEAPKTGFCSKSDSQSSNSSNFSVWAPVVCPNENECLNGRHNCKTAEECIDMENGFTCKCKTGYLRNSSTNQCMPVCQFGCVNGACVLPDVCECKFGWTSRNCSVPCLCNGHSNCPNATHPQICLLCHNKTQGRSCSECLVGYIGDPTANVSCLPCTSFCNNRASLCISTAEAAFIPEVVKRNDTLLRHRLTRGPRSAAEAVCMNCQGNSAGVKCESCIHSYFEKDKLCIKCLCNGHGQTCDNTTGEGCKCQQNTETGDCGKTTDCWKKQCSKCKKNFIGNPVEGRQCFQRMTASQTIAIGTEQHIFGSESKILPIPPTKTYFFTVPPKFTNVNIRLTVDIFQGGVDLFITTENMIFTVDLNYTTGDQMLQLLRKPARRKRDVLVDSSSNDNFPLITVYSTEEFSRERRAASGAGSDTPVWPEKNVTASTTLLSMYTEYKKGLFMVSGVQRRVVIGISYDNQDFRTDKFYIGVVTRGNKHSPLTAGVVYFRQDLPQIDLFVFFSVFFSVFFLILSLFFLAWKVSQLHNGHRAVIAQQIALDTMASRPFSTYSVQCERNEPIRAYRNVHERLLETGNGRKKERQSYTITPMAIENTEDDMAAIVTVFIQFPENEETLWNLAVCSAIVQTSPQQLVTEVACSGQGGSKTTTRYMNTVTM